MGNACVGPKSSAIPAFSRKYQTSCSTCHSDYPELNDFGEAFKKNGFKFPKDDDIFVKEPPVLLGAKAQKEAFPGAIFPGEIPGKLPIAFRYSGNFTLESPSSLGRCRQTGFVPQTDLFVPNTFTIISAGSFGENLAFWIDNDISAGGSWRRRRTGRWIPPIQRHRPRVSLAEECAECAVRTIRAGFAVLASTDDLSVSV